MKWEFLTFEIEDSKKHEILAFMTVRIDAVEYGLFVSRNKGVMQIERFFSGRTTAGPFETDFMLWWLVEVFAYKSLPLVHDSEELHYRFVTFRRYSKDLSKFFEFEKVIDNQSTLDVAEDSVPEDIEELVKEIELQTAINIALDNGDKETFMLLTNQEVTT